MKAIVTAMDKKNVLAFKRLQNDLIFGSHNLVRPVITICCCTKEDLSPVKAVQKIEYGLISSM